MPLVVLVNVGSASAAEVVAGALHDAHRALLVGETTFGTGTVLKEFPLSDGSALLLAVEEWLTPAGHTIWHRGIIPDVEVSLPQTASPLLPTMMRGDDGRRAEEERRHAVAAGPRHRDGGGGPPCPSLRHKFWLRHVAPREVELRIILPVAQHEMERGLFPVPGGIEDISAVG